MVEDQSLANPVHACSVQKYLRPLKFLIVLGLAYPFSTWAEPDRASKSSTERNFVIAARSGNAETVRSQIKSGIDVNALVVIGDETPRSALMVAAEANQSNVVDILLRSRANVNLQNKHGYSALLGASLKGHSLIVAKILAAGANPRIKDSRNYTPLIAAVVSGNVETVRILMEAGGDINDISNDGISVRSFAANSNGELQDYIESKLRTAALKSQQQSGNPCSKAAFDKCVASFIKKIDGVVGGDSLQELCKIEAQVVRESRRNNKCPPN